MPNGRPLWAEIDLDAITHNLRAVRARVGSARVMAVVKANAYGHGAVPVARACVDAGAEYLGVACVDEGIQLREAGITTPVVVIGYCPPWEAGPIVEYGLTASVGDRESAAALAQAAHGAGRRAPVHIKIDSGMARFGARPEDVPDLANAVLSRRELRLDGVYTHFATADEPDKAFTREQFRRFAQATQALSPDVARHVANSATCADLPEMAQDMVRPGMCLYGCQPSASILRPMDLQPALTLKSYVARIHTLPEGETVSYGRTWTAPRPTRVGLVPCGYADGLPRLLSNAGAVLVRGRRAPMLGRVCMDQHMVDLTDIPDAALHDEVVLLGRQGAGEIPAEAIAALAGTINYEVVCAITARVPRVYLRGGKEVDRLTLVSGPGREAAPPPGPAAVRTR